MRILIVSFLVPHSGSLSGAGQVIHGAVTALRGRHEISLITYVPTEAHDRQALRELRANGVEVFVVGDSWPIPIIRMKRSGERLLGRLRGWPALGNPRYLDPRLPALLDRLIRQQRYDILQVEDIGLGNFNYKSTIPSLLIEHEIRNEEHARSTIWGQFDRIQVFTDRDAKALCDAAPGFRDRVRVNPFGINVPTIAEPSRENPDTVLFVGGFNHRPNVDAAIWLGNEILPRLRSLCPGICLQLVGSNPPQKIRRMTGDGIIVTGRVPSVEPYLDRAAVVLAPLRTGGGMRMKVLHAMARGKAIVTTTVGAEGLIRTTSQLPFVVADSANDIAKSTAELLASAEKRQILGHQARDYVRRFHSWSAYRDRLEAIYEELRGSDRDNPHRIVSLSVKP